MYIPVDQCPILDRRGARYFSALSGGQATNNSEHRSLSHCENVCGRLEIGPEKEKNW
jgi:hypothetical protein